MIRLGAILAPLVLISLWSALEFAVLVIWLGIALLVVFTADLVFILVLNRKIRTVAKSAAPAAAPAPKPLPNLTKSLIMAACWFALDAFVMQHGLISILILVLCLFWMAPAAFIARKDKALARFRAGRSAAYFLAAIAAFGVIRLNNSMAARRAEVVIAAVRQYQEKHGRFPDHLQQVVPEFLPAVPLAKYSLMYNDFKYFNAAESARLYYVSFPPFGRNVYYFRSGLWGQLD